MAFVVFIPALLNEEATDAPAHGDDLARRHTADLRSVGASWLRCMLGLAADAAAHMLRRVWCHAEKICFDGSSCRSKVRGTGVNRVVRGGRQRHGLPMEHWWRRDRAASGPTFAAGQRALRGIMFGRHGAFRSFRIHKRSLQKFERIVPRQNVYLIAHCGKLFACFLPSG